MSSTFLSIVMPAFNEAPNFKASVLKPSIEFLGKQKFLWDIIFVDDGSTDDTPKLLIKFCRQNRNYRLIKIPHGGRAAAMRVGILEAKGKYILYADFDQSTPIYHVSEFLKKVNSGFEIVIGSRGYGKTKRKDSLLNKMRANIFVLVAHFFMGLDVQDINCGFKLYKREVAHRIFSNLLVSRPRKINHAYMGAIDSEILFLAKKYKFKIAQVPVNWERKPYISHLNIWKEPAMIILDLITMRLHNFLGHYPKN